jgi:hypothetical protein
MLARRKLRLEIKVGKMLQSPAPVRMQKRAWRRWREEQRGRRVRTSLLWFACVVPWSRFNTACECKYVEELAPREQSCPCGLAESASKHAFLSSLSLSLSLSLSPPLSPPLSVSFLCSKIESCAGAQTVIADARLRSRKNEPAPGGLAEWKEGKLFPEGWERMPLPQKVCRLELIKEDNVVSKGEWKRRRLLCVICHFLT